MSHLPIVVCGMANCAISLREMIRLQQSGYWNGACKLTVYVPCGAFSSMQPAYAWSNGICKLAVGEKDKSFEKSGIEDRYL